MKLESSEVIGGYTSNSIGPISYKKHLIFVIYLLNCINNKRERWKFGGSDCNLNKIKKVCINCTSNPLIKHILFPRSFFNLYKNNVLIFASSFLNNSTIYNCSFVNRYLCRLAVPIIWKDPFRSEPKSLLIDALFACYNKDEDKYFSPIFCTIKFNDQTPLFEYDCVETIRA